MEPRRLTARQAAKESNVAPESYLVRFLIDEAIVAVPSKMVLERHTSATVGKQLMVNWEGQQYNAEVLAFGKYITNLGLVAFR